MSRAALTAHTVVAAVDWNSRWEHTVRHAVARARALDAALHVVHVIEPMPWLLRQVLDAASVAEQVGHRRTLAAEHLEKVHTLATDVEVVTSIREGKTTVEVLAAVEETGAGLLVLGTDGPKDAASILLGGVTERLLRLSPVPVWVAFPGAPHAIREVVTPTGLGPSGAKAIQVGLGAVEGEGRVTALHMVALPSVMRAYSGDVVALRKKLEERARAELADHVAGIERVDGDPALEAVLEPNLETVPAEQTIAATARAREAQLICFALGGRRLDHGLLIGSVSQRLTRVLPCSLLALPDAWVSRQ